MLTPGRGRWNRSLTRAQRDIQERDRIVEAAARARAIHGSAVTLSQIVLEAGVGRNTFYEHFTSVGDALGAADREGIAASARALDEALRSARTPLERLRSVARSFLSFAVQRPDLLDAVAHESAHRPLYPARPSSLESTLRDVLQEARAAGAIGRDPDAVRVRCLVGAFLAAAGLVTGPDAISREEMAEMLTDLTVRAFR